MKKYSVACSLAFLETLSTEIQLLLEVTQSAVLVGRQSWVQLAQQFQFDWEVLLREAGRLGLYSQLYTLLQNAPTAAVPKSALDVLRQAQQNITLRNLHMTGELAALLELFGARHIQVIPFKGPTLAALGGDDLSWRSFADLDVLVARRDVAQASNLLKARGYELQLDWAATQDERFLDVTYTHEFFQPEKGVMVELHWELFPRYMGYKFDFVELQKRVIPVTVAGKPMVTLGREDLLLYLCAHGAKHFWATLNGVVDVARLIQRYDDWDWPALLLLARQRKVERVTLLGLLLAKGLLAAPVPEWVEQQALQDASLKRLAEATVAAMFGPPQDEGGMWRQFRYFFQLQQDWLARLSYLLRLIVAPNVGDWQFQPLPRQWAFLYAVLRPFRLLGKYLNFSPR